MAATVENDQLYIENRSAARLKASATNPKHAPLAAFAALPWPLHLIGYGICSGGLQAGALGPLSGLSLWMGIPFVELP